MRHEPNRVLRGDHCQCAACGLYFNSTKAFDRHRRGKPETRRCLTVPEMEAAGMALNETGWWVTAKGGPPHIRGNSRSGDLPEDEVRATPKEAA